MKVLFTTDGSRRSVDAAVFAAALLPSPSASADVVCVIPDYLPAMTGWDESRIRDRYMRRMEAETNRILNQVTQALAQAGLTAHPIVQRGSPAGTLVQLSRNYGMIVVGARGEQPSSDVGIGPVASHVAHHAACSVLISRPSARANGIQLLAPVDASPRSLLAFRALPSLIAIDTAEVTLMHVTETPWLHLGLEQEWFGYEEDAAQPIDPDARWQRRLRVVAERTLERARDAIASAHPGIQRKIVEGLPANEILSEAEQGGYDLIALGATGVTGLEQQLLGSVSLKVASQAPCSVLIVRSPD